LRSSALLVFAAALPLAACRSAEPPPPREHPYKVVLMPVEGAQPALAAKPKDAEHDVPLALTPESLASAIRDAVKDARLFSQVVVAEPSDVATKGDEDRMQAAARFAKKTESELILRIVVKSAHVTDTGPNGSKVFATLTWFMIPLPIWFKDRTYEDDFQLLAELYETDDPAKPTASVVATAGTQELDLWDRGATPLVLVVPPPFLKGSEKKLSESVTAMAMKQLLEDLVAKLGAREIPSRFEMDVAEERTNAAGGVRVAIASRRRLRSLEIDVDGQAADTWAETGLVEEKDSTPERFAYRRVVPLVANAGAQVRVVAEDEAGGREVRTLVLGGAR
jgi:hypothetical protein